MAEETNENVTVQKNSNGLGVAGFIVAIVALILCWIPTIGWVIGAVALILSVIGLTKKPKGLAIAGLIISVVALIFAIYVSYQAAQAINQLQDAFEGLDALSDSLSAAGAMLDSM